jgi:hypothetical protein
MQKVEGAGGALVCEALDYHSDENTKIEKIDQFLRYQRIKDARVRRKVQVSCLA